MDTSAADTVRPAGAGRDATKDSSVTTTDEMLRDVAARRQRRRLAVLFLVVPVAVAVGVIAGARGHSGVDPAVVVFTLAIAIPAVVLGGVIGVLLVKRSGGYTPIAFGGLARRDRRALVKVLRLGRPVPPHQTALAAELVARTRRLRWLPLSQVVVAVGQLPRLTRGGTWTAVSLVLIVGLLSTAGYTAYVQREVARRTDVL